MENVDWLIVGLGNHTDIYLETRHNIGWMVATAFCQKHHGNLIPISSQYFLAKVSFAGNTILVLLPRTYMNNSGLAVRSAVDKFKIPIDRILVVCDEYNFPLGRIHLKDSGGDGGHNGVASVIENLGASNFLRLRCGIGKNFGENELVQYVLSPFESDEIPVRDQMISRALEAIEYLILKGKSRAMSDINSGNLWKIEISKKDVKIKLPNSSKSKEKEHGETKNSSGNLPSNTE